MDGWMGMDGCLDGMLGCLDALMDGCSGDALSLSLCVPDYRHALLQFMPAKDGKEPVRVDTKALMIDGFKRIGKDMDATLTSFLTAVAGAQPHLKRTSAHGRGLVSHAAKLLMQCASRIIVAGSLYHPEMVMGRNPPSDKAIAKVGGEIGLLVVCVCLSLSLSVSLSLSLSLLRLCLSVWLQNPSLTQKQTHTHTEIRHCSHRAAGGRGWAERGRWPHAHAVPRPPPQALDA